MKLLLDNTFSPITSEIGFLQVDHETAVEVYMSWQQQILGRYGLVLRREQLAQPLDESLRRLLPLSSSIRDRFLFVSTKGHWVAFFDNWWRGTDAAAPMCFLAGKLKCKGLRVVAVPHTMPAEVAKETQGEYGASILEVYDDTGNASRTIYAANDGGKWEFGQSGVPLPFEVLDVYRARRIQDRFNHERMDMYLREMGLRAFDETFYLPSASLIRKEGVCRTPGVPS